MRFLKIAPLPFILKQKGTPTLKDYNKASHIYSQNFYICFQHEYTNSVYIL